MKDCKLVVEEGAFIVQNGKKIPIKQGEYSITGPIHEIDAKTFEPKKQK